MYKRCELILKELESEGKIKVWWDFKFPEKEPLKLRLKDMLEDEVDEKYYLSNKTINTLLKYNKDYETIGISPTLTTELAHSTGKNLYPKLAREIYAAKEPKCVQVGNLHGGKWDKINESCRRVYSGEGISPTVHTCQGGNTEPKVLINNATKKGYDEAVEGDSINLSYPNSNTRRGRVGHQVSQTIQCNDMIGGVVNNNGLHIRKLTPKECWRLMGFDDEDFEKAEKVNSNTQLYKQARKLDLCTSVRKNIRKFIKYGGVIWKKNAKTVNINSITVKIFFHARNALTNHPLLARIVNNLCLEGVKKD